MRIKLNVIEPKFCFWQAHFKILFLVLLMSYCSLTIGQNTTICFGDEASDSQWNGSGNYTTANCNFQLINGGLASMTTQFFPLESGSALIEFVVEGQALENTSIGLDRAIITFIVSEGENYSEEIIVQGNFKRHFSFLAVGSGVIVVVSFQNNADGDGHILGPLSIAATGGLPVEYSSIGGLATGKGNEISWVTSSEVQTEKFEVQRSISGIEWTLLAAVPALGGNESETAYRYLDQNPPTSSALYRLKSIDVDGSIQVSNVIQVKPLAHNNVHLYPNPTSMNLSVELPDIETHKEYLIYNSLGQYVANGALNSLKNTIDVSRLTSGVYHIKIDQHTYPFLKY